MPIPLAECGRGDPRYILSIIVHSDLEIDIKANKTAVTAGALKNGRFSRNQF